MDIRPLPSSPEQEKSILSSMMQDAHEFVGFAIERGLRSDDFGVPYHAVLYTTLLELYEKGQPVELVSLSQMLKDRGMLDNLGGPSGLALIFSAAGAPGEHFEHHLKAVLNSSLLRQLITECCRFSNQAFDRPEEAVELLDRAESGLHALRPSEASGGLVSAQAAAAAGLRGCG